MRKRNAYSRIIQNVAGWGEDSRDFEKGKMINLLYHCMEHDITSFDTADFSGKSVSRTFGTALSESGFGRDNIQIISKFRSSGTNKDLISFVDELLITLRTDYLDLLLLEFPSQPEKLTEDIKRLSSQGKILEIGGLDLQEPEIANLSKLFPLRANQTKPDFFSSEGGKGLVTGNSTSGEIIQMIFCDFGEPRNNPNENTVLKELSEKYEQDVPGLLFSWLLNHSLNLHPVIAHSDEDSITKAAAAKNVKLDPVDLQKINVLST